MNTSLFSLLFFFFLIFFKSSSSVLVCKPSSCSDLGPIIRFPFYLKNEQNNRCGYLGFDLSCNDQSQTIISLPHSGDFLISRIDYSSQSLYLNDPDYCLPQKIVNFSVDSTPFITPPGKNYTFFNCSTSDYTYSTNKVVPLPCLDNKNYIFLATAFRLRDDELPGSCKRIENVSVPLELSLAQYWSSTVLSEDIKLIWEDPKCEVCEAQRMYCGFNGDTGLGIGCSRRTTRGFSKIATYAIASGVGIPLLALLIGTSYCIYNKSRNSGQRNSSHAGILSATAATTGLDSPTINSYPKTVIGESRRILEINDEINCSICLCEYQPQETLRNIPECNHYFHVNCIDEWLKLNGTCPVCRNTLQRIVGPSLPSLPTSSVASIAVQPHS